MMYSPLQIRRIADALAEYYRDMEVPVGTRKSWVHMIGKIEGHSNFDLPSEQEARQIKSTAQWLANFARKRNLDVIFRTREAFIGEIAKFLADPSVGLLNLSATFPSEVDYSLSIKMKNFLSRTPKPKSLKYDTLKLTVTGFVNGTEPLRFALIDLQETNASGILHALAESVPLENLADKDCGKIDVLEGAAVVYDDTSFLFLLQDTIDNSPFIASGTVVNDDGGEGALSMFLQFLAAPNSDVMNPNSVNKSRFDGYRKLSSTVADLFVGRNHRYSLMFRSKNKQLRQAILDELGEMKFDEKSLSELKLLGNGIYRSVVRSEKKNISGELLDLLIGGNPTKADLLRYLEGGARLDVQDQRLGYTAVHVIAHSGWRGGLRLAIEYKDRCNFAALDKAGRPASYAASIFGNDMAMARLLRRYERDAYEALKMPPPHFTF